MAQPDGDGIKKKENQPKKRIFAVEPTGFNVLKMSSQGGPLAKMLGSSLFGCPCMLAGTGCRGSGLGCAALAAAPPLACNHGPPKGVQGGASPSPSLSLSPTLLTSLCMGPWQWAQASSNRLRAHHGRPPAMRSTRSASPPATWAIGASDYSNRDAPAKLAG